MPPTEETIWLAGDIEDAHNRLDHLLGHLPPDFDDGRVALLTCPECGDLACGALTAQMEVAEDVVEWGQLGYNSGAPERPPLLFSPLLTLIFERDAYVSTLEAARKQLVEAVP